MNFQEEQNISSDSFQHHIFERFILAVDIGGTHTTLAVFGIESKHSFQIIFKHKYRSDSITDIKDLINTILSKAKELYNIEIDTAGMGASGPVFEQRQFCAPTKLKWSVDTRRLKQETCLKNIILMNDFEAIGFGIEVFPDEFIEAIPHSDKTIPQPQPKETKALIGAGTGLGEAIIPFNFCKNGYIPIPSEGGNCDFAPRDKLQIELFEFLIKNDLCRQDNHPSWEDVLSGRGILNIFKFITTTDRTDSKEEVIHVLERTENKAEMISDLAKHKNSCCQQTMDLFFELYGQETAALALKSKALGGIYIAGGIVEKDLDLLKDGEFIRAFDNTRSPGHPLHSLIKQTPVFVIKNYDISLYGAANAAANYMDSF